ncbi:MAG: SURF1 family protein [Pseudomonadota bacterium]
MKMASFNPRFWLVTAAALVVAAGTFSLGQWQLRRAAQKEGLQAAIEAQNREPALDTPALIAIKNTVSVVHRPAVLKGTWRAEQTVYLDNRPMSGKSGFFVVTPLVLEGSSQAILVQRGWAPRNFSDRTSLPAVSTPSGPVTVQGRIAPQPSKLYEFKGVETGRIRQNLDLASFSAEISLPLLPVTLLQTGAADEGMLRDWAAPNLGVEKHYGYAFQWFGLCALVVFLYVWFQVIVPFRLRKKP